MNTFKAIYSHKMRGNRMICAGKSSRFNQCADLKFESLPLTTLLLSTSSIVPSMSLSIMPSIHPDSTGVEIDGDEDEALVRRLVQEDVDQAGPSGAATYNDGVRSPIVVRNDILVLGCDTHYRGYGGRGRGIFPFHTDDIDFRVVVSWDLHSRNSVNMG